MLAPLVVFAYNRPEHIRKTLDTLARNKGAKESPLIVFIDGPKGKKDQSANSSVISTVREFEKGCFRECYIVHSPVNKGLSHSVIDGVNKVMQQYGKAIVTEDDSLPALGYVMYMNQALDYYRDNTKVWSIGGYTVSMEIPDDYRHDMIMTQRASSYAWAGWKDRWELIDWDVKDYARFRFDFAARRSFNHWGSDRASMLDDQMNGRVNSWAIRFDYAMFKNDMYNILPTQSLIQNIGFDGSGTHCKLIHFAPEALKIESISPKTAFHFEPIQVDERIRKEFCKAFAMNRSDRTRRYISNLLWSLRRI